MTDDIKELANREADYKDQTVDFAKKNLETQHARFAVLMICIPCWLWIMGFYALEALKIVYGRN